MEYTILPFIDDNLVRKCMETNNENLATHEHNTLKFALTLFGVKRLIISMGCGVMALNLNTCLGLNTYYFIFLPKVNFRVSLCHSVINLKSQSTKVQNLQLFSHYK